MTSSILLAGAYLLLSLGNWYGRGMYDLAALAAVTAGFAFLLIAAWRDARSRHHADVPERLLLIGLLFCLALNAIRPPGIYIVWPPYAIAFQAWNGLLAIGLIVLFLRPHLSWKPLFTAAILAALVFRIGMLFASPSPRIDVFADLQESAQHLLQGRNPYASPVRDVYGSAEPVLQGLVYPPSVFYFHVFAYVLTHDVRAASIAAEAVAAWGLWLLTRGQTQRRRQLAVLLLLSQPVSLFVLEQAWIDPLILAVLAVCLLFQERSAHRASAAAFGILLSMKQYMVFLFPQWFLLGRRRNGWTPRSVVADLLVAGGAALLTFLPFLLWDPRALWENGILYNLRFGISANTLNWAAFLYDQFNIVIGSTASLFVGFIASVASLVAFRSLQPRIAFLYASSITLFALFLLGARAYCNYYYLVSGLLLFLLCLAAPREADAPSGDG